jgi:mono/diheme cytochrome c family protein
MKRLMMRTLAAVATIVAVATALVAIYVGRTWNRTYDAPLPDLRASRDPSVIKRGEYLAYGPSHCVECHAPREEATAAEQHHRKPRLIGGRRFAAPPLGAIYSKNLTPDSETGIGRYTDPQLARMLRYSVRPDGHASVRSRASRPPSSRGNTSSRRCSRPRDRPASAASTSPAMSATASRVTPGLIR